MVDIHLTEDTLRLLAAFEKVTQTQALDCVEAEGKVVFVVAFDKLGQVVGKGGERIRRLRSVLRLDVDVVGLHKDPEQFVRNLFHKVEVATVSLDPLPNGLLATVTVKGEDRPRAIGKGSRNLRLAKLIASRHSNITDIRIR